MQVTFRFYEELNDFLPAARRKRPFRYGFDRPMPVKSAIETLGVPHTEVDLILANGRSVDFDYTVQPDDYLSVYPKFESFDITEISPLRPRPLRFTRFIADVHLGKLARLLRLLGLDTAYRTDYEDCLIIQMALNEQRIILTRDRGMLKNRYVERGYCIRSIEPVSQAREVIQRFNLQMQLNPFTLCTQCNHRVRKVEKAIIAHRLLERTRSAFETFYLCGGCGRIYWKGSHFMRLKARLEAVTK
jgi:uncharacterized protein with PIN domain